MTTAQPTPLPIDPHLPAIVTALGDAGAAVVVAEPGAGKTTRIPAAMLLSGLYPQGEILVLQPRRLAARLAAQRVAAELGEPLGQRVGYQVRFEERASERTRIRFVTEGILTRRLSSSRGLAGVAAVVLDEFHERSLHADFAVACLRRARTQDPALGVVVMSATIDPEPVARFLDAATFAVPGRQFPVDVTYAAQADTALPLERQVARALAALWADGASTAADEDVLVFLPGAAEIRRVQRACAALCQGRGVELHVLHGDLPERELDLAVREGPRPKLILSTNIAETSLTLPRVTTVIDSGLARVAGHSPFSGLPTLGTEPIGQAAAVQRAGRAGRVRPGRCIRLYTEHDFKSRVRGERPEVLRADLSEWCLYLSAVLPAATASDFLSAPKPAALASAYGLLKDLGAVAGGSDGGAGALPALTPLGRRMLTWPLHPRLSRLLIEADDRGVGRAGAAVVALLSERDISLAGRARFAQQAHDVVVGPSDVIARLELFERLLVSNFDPSIARSEEADVQTARRVARAYRALCRGLKAPGPPLGADVDESALGLAVLAAFPDRVAKRRRPAAVEVVFARGGSAQLAETSVVREAEFMVVVDAAEQRGRRQGVIARLASAIEPDWLLELFPDSIETRTETRFDAQLGRVDAHHSLRFFALVLDESRAEASAELLAQALFEAAREQGLAQVFDLAAVESLVSRWAYAGRQGQLPAPPPDAIHELCRLACAGARSLADLARRAPEDYLGLLLDGAQLQRLAAIAPSHVQLPSGCRLQVHYEADRPPYVASRLQDFFGMAEGPRLGGEPLVLHLLAPNQRAVQVTRDLSGFWSRHYPELRTALGRRYPKHAFPEDPIAARPPPPRPPRRK